MPSAKPDTSLGEGIAGFRRFNRAYTRFIGALDEELLSSGFSLAEARVLYEVATREAPMAGEIVSALGIDRAYLSRILARFEKGGFVKRSTSRKDGRSSHLTLTGKGRSRFEKLNTLAEQQARGVLQALPPGSQTTMLASMSAIERLLTSRGEQRPAYVLRPHRPGDMGWVVYREGALYAGEYGFDEGFESLVAQIVADFLRDFDPKRERCWIAEVDGQNVGHVFLVKHPSEPTTARLRLLLVEPSARGLKLGSVLVDECIKFARSVGYKKITLWTQSILLAAHHIYRKSGFRLVAEKPNHLFGQDLVSQTWELDLTA